MTLSYPQFKYIKHKHIICIAPTSVNIHRIVSAISKQIIRSTCICAQQFIRIDTPFDGISIRVVHFKKLRNSFFYIRLALQLHLELLYKFAYGMLHFDVNP